MRMQEEDPICLQCGDKGWTNSFVYCIKCLQFAVHRYCLDVIPQTLDEFVPWYCHDCDVKTRAHHSTSKHVQGDEETDRFGDEVARWVEAVAALEDASRKAKLSKEEDMLNVIVSLEAQLMECKKMLCRAQNEVKRVTEENVKLKKALHNPTFSGATRARGPSKRGYQAR